MTVTKDQLRGEIAELRRVGQQMSNVLYNLSQHQDVRNVPGDAQTMRALVKDWDSIERREKTK